MASTPPSQTPETGQRISFDGALCTIRFVGEVAGTAGIWLGVEWDDPSRGKHDGCHKGIRYFTCLSGSPTAASFVRPTRPSDLPQTFVSAVHDKYASEELSDTRDVDLAEAGVGAGAEDGREKVRGKGKVKGSKEIVISGKVAEEVGFDKVRRQLAQLHELKVMILDGARIASAQSTEEKSIRETCPRITELDLSRNLLPNFATVVDICSQLDELRSLRLNGNRFHAVQEDQVFDGAGEVFIGVKELGLEETLLSWEQICHVTSRFRSLASILCGLNQLSILASPAPSALAATLISVSLEYNEFVALSDFAYLRSLTSLHNLHLKGNNISSVTRDSSQPTPVFATSVRHLDISYNQIASWSFVDALPDCFPGLTSLRIAHNPVYDGYSTSSPEQGGPPGGTSAPLSQASKRQAASNDDPFMITVARLARLDHLNFSAISPAERTNAEMFYLSRIGRQVASVPEGSEVDVLAQHRRYAELCGLYGEPVVTRQQDLSQSFLEGRLITVHFRYRPLGDEDADGVEEARWMEIPRSFDMYAVKGIAGRLFGKSPLDLRLVWETGEWDPVAGLSDEAGESSGGEDEGAGDTGLGRLARRHVELIDSPRQFGYCVDGPEARIRVEPRYP